VGFEFVEQFIYISIIGNPRKEMKRNIFLAKRKMEALLDYAPMPYLRIIKSLP